MSSRNPIPQPDPQLPVGEPRDRALYVAGLLVAFASAIGLGALAAHENCPSELEAMRQTALAVKDADTVARQAHADHLFNRRVQLAGDVVCIRVAGPGARAVWSGPDETLHCVSKEQPQQPRLLLAESGH